MADVFLSYAREDRAAAERIALALGERGYEVWWDPDIPAGPSYAQVIEQALASAKCVVVLWSAASVGSSWVHDEAREGQERGVLVAARLADLKPPMGFRSHQLADLTAWDGRGDDREFRRLVRGVEAHVPPRASAPPAAPVVARVPGDASVPRTPVAERPTEPIPPPPLESTASGWPGEAETQSAETTGAPSVGEAVRGAAAAVGGALNGLAIAAVVAVVLVSGTLVFLRDEGSSPGPSSAAKPRVETGADANPPPDSATPPVTAPPSSQAETSAAPAVQTTPSTAAPLTASRSSAPARGASGTAPAAASPATASPIPRFRADAWQLPDEPLLGFIEVPAGQFTMGSDRRQDSLAREDEMPQHKVTLPAFFIGKYEVTVAQYKACADDGGCKPGTRDALAGRGDLPVRNLTWHEAIAYCAWLEAKLRVWRDTPGSIADALAGRRDGGVAWRITLPSEAEWERAARGTDARIYPWGTGIDPSKANYYRANRGGPTPVGMFPAGASPVGAMDMAGNVWEWTRTLHGFKYPYTPGDGRERLGASRIPPSATRVVRGASFGDDDVFARAAYRYNLHPDRHFDFIGFRVVVSRSPS